MLDIIEKVLKKVKLSRIDGSTREKERQRLVDDFNNSHSVEAMLLSTKAAGGEYSFSRFPCYDSQFLSYNRDV